MQHQARRDKNPHGVASLRASTEAADSRGPGSVDEGAKSISIFFSAKIGGREGRSKIARNWATLDEDEYGSMQILNTAEPGARLCPFAVGSFWQCQ